MTNKPKIVLVGTYKAKQLSAWPGYYNYPITKKDDGNIASFAAINELWLFNGTKDRKIYSAEFMGVKSRRELVESYGYPATGKPHGDRYLLFRTSLRYAHATLPPSDPKRVVVRVTDFATSPKIRTRLKAYLEAAERGDDPSLAALLPKSILDVPRDRLCVCQSMAQLELPLFAQPFSSIYPHSRPRPTLRIDNGSYADLLRALSPAPTPCGQFTHVDCFSGVGGFCTGLHAAGFETRVAIEKIESCVETYSVNHPEVHTICGDIRNVSAMDILPFCPQEGVDLVTSGMPCETFSTAGNTSRSFYDDRQFLFREGIRIAKISNAKFLLFENVPGITSKTTEKGGNILIVDILKKELVAAGYSNFVEVVLDAASFGVPQHRKRFFILSTRLPWIRLRHPLSHLHSMFTVGDAFEGLPPVVPNTWREGTRSFPVAGCYAKLMRDETFWKRPHVSDNSLSYHMPMKHRPATLERFALLAPGESLRELFGKFRGEELERLQARRVLPRKLFIKRNYRLPLQAPSPTVTSHCLDEFVHPSENRALTVRECARLQSFPDSYDFAGGPYIIPHINRDVQDKYEQIGDAVPPLLAYAWGKTILAMLAEERNRP